MISLAEVLRRHWPAYERKFGARLLPSHKRAVAALLSCHTPSLGGQLYRCDCGRMHYAYHSCNHRACPQCGHANTEVWLEKRRRQLLPLPYYLVTFTVPEALRRFIRSHPMLCYDALLRESAGALLDVAGSHKNLRAHIGLLALLQTWTRDLRYHPHVHCLVPAGGLSEDGLRWARTRDADYFLPQQMLAARFRNRFKAALSTQPALFKQIPAQVWRQCWVADVQKVGNGQALLKYLGAYIYRSAFSSQKIVADDGQSITFAWRDNRKRQRTTRLKAEAFLHRYLQHVLPRGFQRVRHYGWLSPAARQRWERILALLDWKEPALKLAAQLPPPQCPVCHQPMLLVARLPRAPP